MRRIKQIGVSEKVAERDACMIEHVVSEETYSKLKNYIADKRLRISANA